MTKMQIIAFDLDGTLIDSRADIVAAVNYSLHEQGLPIRSFGDIVALVGRGAEQLIRDAAPAIGAERFQTLFQTFIRYYAEHLLDQTQLYPGAFDFLESLSGIPKALITNKPELLSRRILQHLQLEKFFDWVIGGDSLAVQKPDPAMIAPIEKTLGRIESGIMVGDSPIDIAFGRACGLKTCILSHGFSSRAEIEGADFIVDSFAEMGELPLFRSM